MADVEQIAGQQDGPRRRGAIFAPAVSLGVEPDCGMKLQQRL
jgi:hypothetical protein